MVPDSRSEGGFVSALTPYLVGERGPELFIPGVGYFPIPEEPAEDDDDAVE